MSDNKKVRDWRVRVYDEDNNGKIKETWIIRDRTEEEAEKEADSEICHRIPIHDGWSMSPVYNKEKGKCLNKVSS
jgi:hypothetical protein